jgi:curved DNA-binding protein CbpA
VSHYDVLGVRPDAGPAELRRAYLALARRHHPDRHAGDPAETARAEARMQQVNAAWAVLGDPETRARYDRQRVVERRAAFRPGAVSPDFVPVDEGEDPEDPAAEHDVPYGDGSPVHRSLQVGPFVVLVLGLVALGSGLLLDFGPLLALGLVGIVGGLLAFAATPFYAVLRSHHRTR